MKKVISVLLLIVALSSTTFLFTGCGKHYCSYGGCMREVEHAGDRCSAHKGLKNDPNYGIPDKWKTHNYY